MNNKVNSVKIFFVVGKNIDIKYSTYAKITSYDRNVKG